MPLLTQDFLLLDQAEGTIQATDAQQDRLDELTTRLAQGEFQKQTYDSIPCKCIDGRSCPAATDGPNSAGGTETLFVADDLTSKRFAAKDGSVAGGMRNIIMLLESVGLPVGGHSDNMHIDPQMSGCGANDKLGKIYGMIVHRADAIRAIAETLLGEGVVDDAAAERIVENAHNRGDFPAGGSVLAVYEQVPDARLEELDGTHNEVVAVINMKPQTTLDRKALADEFGNDYQAFNVDAWSFQKAAEAIATDPTEIRHKVIAMTYYNIATALVLCGPQMRVVVVSE
jgi:hypothetical protein